MTIDSAPIEPGELVGQIMHTGTLDHCLMDLYAVEPSVSDYQMEELVPGPEEVGCAEGDVYLDHVGQNLSYRFVAHDDPDDTGTAVLRPEDRGSRWGSSVGCSRERLGLDSKQSELQLLLAQFNRPDVEYPAELIETGKVTAVVDRWHQGLCQVGDDLRYLGEGHARGKVVVTV